MLYFAYGSNLDVEMMKERCPAAVPLAKALLEGHQLGYKRWSDSWKGGVSTIVPSMGQEVWGLLYEINKADLQSLDAVEGYDPMKYKDQNAYNRDERIVFKKGDTNQPLCAWVYVAVPQGDYFRPTQSYLDSILKSAKLWDFPPAYLDSMAKVSAGKS